jgi:hypothetical protein
MIEILVLIFVAMTGIAFALTGVLLLKFWAGGLSPLVRVLAAILLGCLGPGLLLAGVAISDGLGDALESVVVLAIIMVPMALVAWPAAHFATRKLDKLTEQMGSVFE